MRRLAASLASFALYLPTIIRVGERIIGWAGLPGDMQTWWSLWEAITVGVPVIEVWCLVIATPLVLVAIFGDPRKWFFYKNHRDPGQLPAETATVLREPDQRLKPRDIERQMEAIDNVLDVIGFDRPLHSSLQDMLKLRSHWQQKLDAGEIGEYLPQLHSARDGILDALRSLNRLAKTAERYPEIWAAASELSNQDATYPISEFIDNLKRLDKDTPPKTRQLFEPYAANCRKAIIGMEEARDATTKKMLAIRQGLSQG